MSDIWFCRRADIKLNALKGLEARGLLLLYHNTIRDTSFFLFDSVISINLIELKTEIYYGLGTVRRTSYFI